MKKGDSVKIILAVVGIFIVICMVVFVIAAEDYRAHPSEESSTGSAGFVVTEKKGVEINPELGVITDEVVIESPAQNNELVAETETVTEVEQDEGIPEFVYVDTPAEGPGSGDAETEITEMNDFYIASFVSFYVSQSFYEDDEDLITYFSDNLQEQYKNLPGEPYEALKYADSLDDWEVDRENGIVSLVISGHSCRFRFSLDGVVFTEITYIE